jgi:hypothetical protein
MYDVIRPITDRVKLIKYNNQLLILKTYKNHQSKNEVMEYINILNNHKLPTLQYYNYEWQDDNQLCLNYIPKFHTFDKKKSEKDFALVGKYLKQVHSVLDTGIGNLDNSNIMIVEDQVFFLNPNFESTKAENIELFLKTNLSKSRHFQTSLNQQETRQNEFLDAFLGL